MLLILLSLSLSFCISANGSESYEEKARAYLRSHSTLDTLDSKHIFDRLAPLVQSQEALDVYQSAFDAIIRTHSKVPRSRNGQSIYLDARNEIKHALESVLPAIHRPDQARLYQSIFEQFEAQDPHYRVSNSIFLTLTPSEGLSPNTVSALSQYLVGSQWRNETKIEQMHFDSQGVEKRLEFLVQIKTESQLRTFQKWAEHEPFLTLLHSRGQSERLFELLALLPKYSRDSDEFALGPLARFVIPVIGQGADHSIDTLDLLDGLLEGMEVHPDHPHLRQQAFGMMIEALSDYQGFHIPGGSDDPILDESELKTFTASTNGGYRAAKHYQMSRPDGVGAQLLGSINQIQSPIDLELLRHHILPKKKGTNEQLIDFRRMQEFGGYPSKEAVIATRESEFLPFRTQEQIERAKKEKKRDHPLIRGLEALLSFCIKNKAND